MDERHLMEKQAPYVREIGLDLSGNRLRLRVEGNPFPKGYHQAVLDVGARGRLIGLELGEHYLDIATTLEPDLVRSATVTVQIDTDGAVWIDRHHANYEISFPSGNQCWRTAQGRSICSILLTS